MRNGDYKSMAALRLCQKIEEARTYQTVISQRSQNGMGRATLAKAILQGMLNDTQCKQIISLRITGRNMIKQCSRKAGYGRDRLFCKQHAKRGN